MKLFQKHTTTRSRVIERNPTVIKIEKPTSLPLLKSGNSRDFKRPITNQGSVIGRNSKPFKVTKPTSLPTIKNHSNKPLTKKGM